MYNYSFTQWLLFFYIYCFVGWCIESTIVSIEKRKFVNRGFLRSPFLPIYGFGAIVILFVSLPVRKSPVMVYICGMVGTTVLEYFTGWLMETTLKMRYWDYSGQKFNIKGRICITSSLFWGLLSLFLTYVLHSPVEYFVTKGLNFTGVVTVDIIISCIFVSDTVYAFKTALDINKILEKVTAIRKEISANTEQLEKMVAEKIEDSETINNLKIRIEELKAELSGTKQKLGFFKTDFIKAHPTAKSKFNEALVELREAIETRKNK